MPETGVRIPVAVSLLGVRQAFRRSDLQLLADQWALTHARRFLSHQAGRDGIESGAVTSPKLAAGAIGAAQLADGVVSTAKLLDGSVTAGKLAAGSVGSGQLGSGSVGATSSPTAP